MEDTQNRGKTLRKSRSILLKTHHTTLRVFNEEGILQSEEQINQANTQPRIEQSDSQIEYQQRGLRKKQPHFLFGDTSPKNEKQSPSPKNLVFSKLMTSVKVKQITNNFLNNLSTRRFQFLKNKQFSLIDDKATDIHQNYKIGEKPKENKTSNDSYFQQILKLLPIFYPQNGLKLTWEIILQIAVITYFFCIPIHLSLDINLSQLVNESILQIMLLIIILDILINFNTGFFHKGQFVTSRRRIALNYCYNFLLIDIISCLPLVLYFLLKKRAISFLLVLFFIKTDSFAKTFRKFEELIRMKQTALNILQLFKLLFTVLFFTHIFACVWIFIGENSSSAKTWLTTRQLVHSPWYSVYLNAYYFVTVTMITVGYGDIVPENQLEMVTSILMMLISCGVYAYTLNRVGAIFEELYHQQRQTQRDLMILNNYMDQKNISFSLKYQIREYLDYYWRESNQNNDQIEHTILAQLSDTLRQNLLIEANKIILKDSPIFNQNFSERLLQRTLALIQEAHYTPEQEIFLLNQKEDNYIYFIEKGKVELFISLSQKKGRQIQPKSLKIICEGESFGVRSFFMGIERYMSARSVDFTKLLFIKRNDFLELLKEFPEDYETFCMIRDMLFQGKSYKVGKKCYCCNNSNLHDFMNCPYIHYVPDKYKVIRRAYGVNQARDSEYTRGCSVKENTLKGISSTQAVAMNFQQKNSKLFKQLSWIGSSFQSFPNTETSFSHIDENMPTASDGTLSKNEGQSEIESSPQNQKNSNEQNQGGEVNPSFQEVKEPVTSQIVANSQGAISPFESEDNNNKKGQVETKQVLQSKISSLQNLSEVDSSDSSEFQSKMPPFPPKDQSSDQNNMKEIHLERKHRAFKNLQQIKLNKPATPKISKQENEDSHLKTIDWQTTQLNQVHIFSQFYGMKSSPFDPASEKQQKSLSSLSSSSSSSSSSSFSSPQNKLQSSKNPPLFVPNPQKNVDLLPPPPRLNERSKSPQLTKQISCNIQRKNTDSPALKNPKTVELKKEKISPIRELSGNRQKRRASISVAQLQGISEKHLHPQSRLSINNQINHKNSNHLSPHNLPPYLAHLSHITSLARRSSFHANRATQNQQKTQDHLQPFHHNRLHSRQSSSSNSSSSSSQLSNSSSSSGISIPNTLRESLADIDKLKLFKKYYPRFNYDEVIKMTNYKLQKNLKKSQAKNRTGSRKQTFTLGNRASQNSQHNLLYSSPFSSINKKQVMTHSDNSFKNNFTSGKGLHIPMQSLDTIEYPVNPFKKDSQNGSGSMQEIQSFSGKNSHHRIQSTLDNQNHKKDFEQNSNYHLLTPSHQQTTANPSSFPPANNLLKKRVTKLQRAQIVNRRKSHVINPVTFSDSVFRRYSASQETGMQEVQEQQQLGHNELLSGMSSQFDINKNVLNKSDLQSIKSIQENGSQIDFEDRLDSIQQFQQPTQINHFSGDNKDGNKDNKYNLKSQKSNPSYLHSFPSSVSLNSQIDFKYPDVLQGLDQQGRSPKNPLFSPSNAFDEITALKTGENKTEPIE